MTALADIQYIPLDMLVPSEQNVRKTSAGAAAEAQLDASIRSQGVIHPLVVTKLDTEPGIIEYAVQAGGRRLRVLKNLAEEGLIESGDPIRCIVLPAGTTDERAQTISLAENIVRSALHPADEFDAFVELIDSGLTVPQIAQQFGCSERVVQQRLRLGNVAPQIMAAYREGKTNLEVVTAYAMTSDHSRQIDVWESVQDTYYATNAHSIRQMLTEKDVRTSDRRVRFVGVEEYQAAGGSLTVDLFDDDDGRWITDTDLLNRLTIDKLNTATHELEEQWRWVEVHLDLGWDALHPYSRMTPTPAEPTDEESTELEPLFERLGAIKMMSSTELSTEVEAERAALHRQINRIEDRVKARATFSPEDMKHAGCLVSISYSGELEVKSGLVRNSDVQALQQERDARTETDGNKGVQDPVVPHLHSDLIKEVTGVSRAHSEDLAVIRNTVIKAHLADNYGVMFDLALYSVAKRCFPTESYYGSSRSLDVDIIPSHDGVADNLRVAAASAGLAVTAEVQSALPLDWIAKPPEEGFTEMCALPDADKQRIFAAAFATAVKPQLAFSVNPYFELEETIGRLNIDWPVMYRPTAASYWKRLNKAHILRIAGETLGDDWAAHHKKDKKGDLVDLMERVFARGDHTVEGLTPEARAEATAWMPPGFLPFDRVV